MYKIEVRRAGDAAEAALPKEFLDEIHAEAGDVLYLVKRNGEFVVTPCDPGFDETMAAFEEVRSEFRNAFRELAT